MKSSSESDKANYSKHIEGYLYKHQFELNQQAYSLSSWKESLKSKVNGFWDMPFVHETCMQSDDSD